MNKPKWNTENLPETTFGYCENSRHEDDENQQKEKLDLILRYDEDNNIWSKSGVYWCESCSEKDCD